MGETFRGRPVTPLAFGTSGLRGRVEDITDLEAYVNTRGFLRFLGEGPREVALAGDLRPSTSRIMAAVAAAVRDDGGRVHHCGRIPTPALTLFGLEQGLPTVMVTGSHIPFDRNGIKFGKPDGEVLKDDEPAILEAVAAVRSQEYGRPAQDSLFDDDGAFRSPPPPLPEVDPAAADAYVQRYEDFFGTEVLSGLRVGLYAHSAVGRDLLARILTGLGAAVVPMGRTTEFVAIDTEAISAERLRQIESLARAATDAPLDAIVSTDGDSDRPLIVGFETDRSLRFLGGDLVGIVTASRLGADAIAVPVSAIDAIERVFEGVVVQRTRIGSPWVVAAMAQMAGERIVGWEANGGFLVGSPIRGERGTLAPLPTRDAVLPIVAVLEAARRNGSAVAAFDALPARFTGAGLMDDVPKAVAQRIAARFAPPPSVRAVWFHGEGEWMDFGGLRHADGDWSRLREVARDLEACFAPLRMGRAVSIDWLDGIRVVFDGDEVAHVRPSGNAPQLRLYASAGSRSRVERIVEEGAGPGGVLEGLVRAAEAHPR